MCTKKIMRNPDIQNKMKCTADNTGKRFEVFETLKKIQHLEMYCENPHSPIGEICS